MAKSPSHLRARVALALIWIQLIGSPGSALTASEPAGQTPSVLPLEIGNVEAALPIPEGFVVADNLPAEKLAVLESMTPDSNRLLAFLIPKESLHLMQSTAGSPISRYAIVQTIRATEHTTATQAEFQQLVVAPIKESWSSADSAETATLDKLRQEVSEQSGVELVGFRHVGFVLDQEDALSQAAVVKLVANEGRAPTLATFSYLRVRGKVLFVFLYSSFRGPEDLEWLYEKTSSWVEDILRLNGEYSNSNGLNSAHSEAGDRPEDPDLSGAQAFLVRLGSLLLASLTGLLVVPLLGRLRRKIGSDFATDTPGEGGWHLLLGDQQRGPMSGPEVRSELWAADAPTLALVRKAGLEQWTAPSSVAVLNREAWPVIKRGARWAIWVGVGKMVSALILAGFLLSDQASWPLLSEHYLLPDATWNMAVGSVSLGIGMRIMREAGGVQFWFSNLILLYAASASMHFFSGGFEAGLMPWLSLVALWIHLGARRTIVRVRKAGVEQVVNAESLPHEGAQETATPAKKREAQIQRLREVRSRLETWHPAFNALQDELEVLEDAHANEQESLELGLCTECGKPTANSEGPCSACWLEHY